MRLLFSLLFFILCFSLRAQETGIILLDPEWVFDGYEIHEDWRVIVDNGTITYSGPVQKSPSEFKNQASLKLPGITLMPGLIEGHSHLLLHPYNETAWNDQVLKESQSERTIRAVKHAEATLKAGITTSRDLGSEGAGYADVALRDAIRGNLMQGPDLLVAGPAMVITGSYGPKGFHEGVHVPLGAQEADGIEGVARVAREQIGHGVDFIKVYADYRWGPDGSAQPTFSLEELKTIVETARSSGWYVVAHAATEEGMRRAILAGVETIEHGDNATEEILRLMKENNVGYCPTLAAVEAISRYNGYDPSKGPEPERIKAKKESFQNALKSGVQIVFGGDVGVFTHGKNAWELELMVDYGMGPIEALRAATSGNASVFHLDDRGWLKNGYRADIIGVRGNPLKDISTTMKPVLVLKNGERVVWNIGD